MDDGVLHQVKSSVDDFESVKIKVFKDGKMEMATCLGERTGSWVSIEVKDASAIIKALQKAIADAKEFGENNE